MEMEIKGRNINGTKLKGSASTLISPFFLFYALVSVHVGIGPYPLNMLQDEKRRKFRLSLITRFFFVRSI